MIAETTWKKGKIHTRTSLGYVTFIVVNGFVRHWNESSTARTFTVRCTQDSIITINYMAAAPYDPNAIMLLHYHVEFLPATWNRNKRLFSPLFFVHFNFLGFILTICSSLPRTNNVMNLNWNVIEWKCTRYMRLSPFTWAIWITLSLSALYVLWIGIEFECVNMTAAWGDCLFVCWVRINLLASIQSEHFTFLPVDINVLFWLLSPFSSRSWSPPNTVKQLNNTVGTMK